MLGRLEMDVDECISTYTELMEDVFKKKKHQSRVNFLFEVQPQFDSTRLKRAIEKAIRLKGRSPDEPFSSGPGSKVFVCATSKDINTGIRLRSYKLSQYPDNVHPTICQAALATSAATTFFNPVVIGTRTFVDGALWANNPVDEVEREATDIWCSESGELTPLIKCFISIGTGNSGLKPVKDRRLTSLVETLARITTETEGTARKSMARFRGLLEKGRYFRFNVEQGLQHVGLEEFRAAPVIEAATEDYLDSQERQAKVTSCVANLIHKENMANANLEKHMKVQLTALDKKCLRKLRIIDPQDDMTKIENEKERLCYNAYEWIFHTTQYAAFVNWENDQLAVSPCQLLWIKGHAGTGKTMLLIGIIRELESRFGPQAVYFFCQGTDSRLNNATAILRSLIWVLLQHQPHLISHLRTKYEYSGKELFTDGNAFYALSKVFHSMLEDPNLLPAYFVVDALDECDRTIPGSNEIIELISNSFGISSKIKWLVSSRSEVNFLAKLESVTQKDMVDLDRLILEAPINAYITHQLSYLKGLDGYDKETLETVSREVRQRASDTFLWVAFVFKELTSVDGHDAVSVIQRIPSGLLKQYEYMMNQIEEGTEEIRQCCKDVLKTVFLAYRPLSLTELAVLVKLRPKMAEKAINKCGSFLKITKSTVSLIHPSAKDYLGNNYGSKIQSTGIYQGHIDVSRRSIDAMTSILKRNIYNLSSTGFILKRNSNPKSDPLAPIQYCCLFWAEHIFRNCESPECKRELTDDGAVYKFLVKLFLPWLESLSLLEKFFEGVRLIRKLLHVVQASGASPLLAGFLEDAEKFVQSHGFIIDQAPLQAYSSALVFSPTTSPVKIAQWKERLPCIKMATGIRDHWGIHQQTLEGHSRSVTAITFSPNGKLLASASEDFTIVLWNAETGEHQQKFTGHSRIVRAVAFSPDSKMLASGSVDRTVRLWNIATRECQQTLTGHENSVSAITFTLTTETLISTSRDRTIRLWNTKTGKCLQIMTEHRGAVSAVAISTKTKSFASASHDHTIWLWDLPTSTHCLASAKKQLIGHSDWVNAVAFSSDGNKLVSGSRDRTIRLWDTATGLCQQTITGHDSSVNAVGIVPNCQILMSGSNDREVRVWNASACIRSLTGHHNSINAIAISPDGKTMASGSRDCTVWLWETAAITKRQTSIRHRTSTSTVAISPDGKMLASGSCDCTIRLWDIATGEHQKTFQGHSGKIYAIAFPPQSETLVSASDNGTVWLWNIATGEHWLTLGGGNNEIYTCTFSAGGKTLATASRDGTIQLWDAATGVKHATIESKQFYKGLSFSKDGRYLKTDYGSYSLSAVSILPDIDPNFDSNHALTIDHNWLCLNKEKVVWLPKEYRPTSVAYRGNIIVLGQRSGGLIILQLEHSHPR
ncbi:WD40-repeat-containing domain protein [Xylaria curta]|nr:WD40-repeat-containing domain protein [Xylaria curta]